MENRITNTFTALKQKNQKALVTYITAGYPDFEATEELVLTLEKSGANLIELGVPFSDPLADGPVIQHSSQLAIKAGATLPGILDTVARLRKKTHIPIVLMSYYNPLFRYGLLQLAENAASAGVDGFIIPDLPHEEAGEFASLLKDKGICLIPLVAPTTVGDRITHITQDYQGFIYCVSVTGVTGVRNSAPEGLSEFMAEVREKTELPLGIGFGVSNAEQAKAISQHGDAVIVGSAIVKLIIESQNREVMLAEVSKLAKELSLALKEQLT